MIEGGEAVNRVDLVTADDAESVDVAIRGLGKRYGSNSGTVALDGINLEIPRRQFVSIVGPSGCGKSTLLKCVAGLTDITSGSIVVHGRSVTEPPENMAVVFQRDILLDWRRVLDNILLPIDFRRQPRAAWISKANDLLNTMGIGGMEKRYPWELSGGQRQRVAICRALIQDPALLLMDEPFGALDAMTRDELNLELQRIWLRTHKTVLFITHGISEAVFLSDRVVVMGTDPGRIVEIVTIDLPRPRTLDMRETPEFGLYAKRIRHIFQDMGFLRATA
jgi:NitT/TauT family transport system ATP-binding protein